MNSSSQPKNEQETEMDPASLLAAVQLATPVVDASPENLAAAELLKQKALAESSASDPSMSPPSASASESASASASASTSNPAPSSSPASEESVGLDPEELLRRFSTSAARNRATDTPTSVTANYDTEMEELMRRRSLSAAAAGVEATSSPSGTASIDMEVEELARLTALSASPTGAASSASPATASAAAALSSPAGAASASAAAAAAPMASAASDATTNPLANAIYIVTYHSHGSKSAPFITTQKFSQNQKKFITQNFDPLVIPGGFKGVLDVVNRHKALCVEHILQGKVSPTSYLVTEANLGFSGRSLDIVGYPKFGIVDTINTMPVDVDAFIDSHANLLSLRNVIDNMTLKVTEILSRFKYCRKDDTSIERLTHAQSVELAIIGAGGDVDRTFDTYFDASGNPQITHAEAVIDPATNTAIIGPPYLKIVAEKNGCWQVTELWKKGKPRPGQDSPSTPCEEARRRSLSMGTPDAYFLNLGTPIDGTPSSASKNTPASMRRMFDYPEAILSPTVHSRSLSELQVTPSHATAAAAAASSSAATPASRVSSPRASLQNSVASAFSTMALAIAPPLNGPTLFAGAVANTAETEAGGAGVRTKSLKESNADLARRLQASKGLSK